MSRTVSIRPATSEDLTGVLGVLDAAALETDAEQIRERIDRGDVFVAVRIAADAEPSGSAASENDTARDTVLGGIVLVVPEGVESAPKAAHIEAIGVRRRRRGQGIGRQLVEAAADEYDRLRAKFDAGVRPFYESLGFIVEPVDSEGTDRYRGEFVRTENQS